MMEQGAHDHIQFSLIKHFGDVGRAAYVDIKFSTQFDISLDIATKMRGDMVTDTQSQLTHFLAECETPHGVDRLHHGKYETGDFI
ncbi:hypothetical protein PPNSA23_41520 [Phyllobacterium phragmitis]|uniref:Uncharacterized protein n=1 Tax=Phyllobacterium phragmitis TaxID=2670329 RepID=A0ABQ0H5L1_9HYPH